MPLQPGPPGAGARDDPAQAGVRRSGSVRAVQVLLHIPHLTDQGVDAGCLTTTAGTVPGKGYGRFGRTLAPENDVHATANALRSSSFFAGPNAYERGGGSFVQPGVRFENFVPRGTKGSPQFQLIADGGEGSAAGCNGRAGHESARTAGTNAHAQAREGKPDPQNAQPAQVPHTDEDLGAQAKHRGLSAAMEAGAQRAAGPVTQPGSKCQAELLSLMRMRAVFFLMP